MKTRTDNTTYFSIIAIIALTCIGFITVYNNAFAQTLTPAEEEVYMYIDEWGNEQFEVADTPKEAMDDAENIKENSGVILISQTVPVVSVISDDEEEIYLYVDIFGNLKTEIAEDPQEAFGESEWIDPKSGVMVISR